MLDSEVPENLSISISESLALTAPDHVPQHSVGAVGSGFTPICSEPLEEEGKIHCVSISKRNRISAVRALNHILY